MSTLYQLREIRDRLKVIHDTARDASVIRHAKEALHQVEKLIELHIQRQNQGGKP